MQKYTLAKIALLLLLVSCSDLPASDEQLARAIASDSRSAKFVQRDSARHPQQVLEFFGIRPDLAVAEIWPSAGWWSEILAPYLKDQGRYYAVGFSLTAKRTPQWRKNMAIQLIETFNNNPEQYGEALVTSLSVPEDTVIAPPGSLDMVLTFRNVHNWIKGDYDAGVFQAMFTALKPGGILGLVEHRAPEDFSLEYMKQSGYVTEAYVIEAARAAGFELLEKSEINANPNDSKNHPAGVWSLPPGLRACGVIDDPMDAEQCREKYRAIGESDRMTLKFIKPV